MPGEDIGVLVKPAGPDCNLACTYCFYRPKAELYPDSPRHRMSDEVLEEFIGQYMAMSGEQVAFAWQGGEPTLMGLDFFRRVVDYQQRLGQSGQRVSNSLQTNGILLDDDWCQFLAEYKFLVGISIDGPTDIHDHFRIYPSGNGSYEQVIAAQDRLQAHRVEHNCLAMVTPVNIQRPEEVYRYLTEELQLEYLQFIPLVEQDPATGELADFSIAPRDWGDFLCRVFDLWSRKAQSEVHVRVFDDLMTVYAGGEPPSCQWREQCGSYVVVEHNGDVYCCDFFVEPQWKLGNLVQTPLTELVKSERFAHFARRKSEIGEKCRECEWLQMCWGGCPKHRLVYADDASAPSYLCAGYQQFFAHSHEQLQRRVRRWLAQQRNPAISYENVGRNDPCPCGSGEKYKKCCML